MLELIWYSLVGGLFSLIGGLVLVWRSELANKIITPLLSFAAGAFLGASLLDILPEALEAVERPQPVLIAVLVGFTLFFALERLLMRYIHGTHQHDVHSDHTETLPFLVILGDSLHNFLDGIVIAFAYLANPALGLTTALAIAAHEIPQEIGDFSILLSLGWAKSRIILINVFSSLMTIVGVLLGYYGGQLLESWLPYLLAGTAGTFIYLAASDIIPEIHHRTGHKEFHAVIWPMIISMIAIGYLVTLAHRI